MEIDKSIDRWVNSKTFNNVPITYLDDLAYYIYCQFRKRRRVDNITPQSGFFVAPKVYKRFYDDAKVIIRKEKIEKIEKRKNENL